MALPGNAEAREKDTFGRTAKEVGRLSDNHVVK